MELKRSFRLWPSILTQKFGLLTFLRLVLTEVRVALDLVVFETVAFHGKESTLPVAGSLNVSLDQMAGKTHYIICRCVPTTMLGRR